MPIDPKALSFAQQHKTGYGEMSAACAALIDANTEISALSEKLRVAREALEKSPCDSTCESSVACRNFYPHSGDEDFCGRCLRHRNMHKNRSPCNCSKSHALAALDATQEEKRA